MIQDVRTVAGDHTLGTDLPVFASNNMTWTGVTSGDISANGTVSWDPIPDNLTSSWDSYALIVDDVLRYQGSATTFNLSSLLSFYQSDSDLGVGGQQLDAASTTAFNTTIVAEPHYLRLAYVSSGSYGDSTRAAVAYFNGTWRGDPPGAT